MWFYLGYEPYPRNNYVFIQDGAPFHTAKRTQQFLAKHFANFWPASSPDLNVLDYTIWSVVDAKACSKPHVSVEAVKASIMVKWNDISKDYLIHAFRR